MTEPTRRTSSFSPFNIAMLAALLCQNDQIRKTNFPIRTKTPVPEDFLDEAIDLISAAQIKLDRKIEQPFSEP